MQRRFIEMRITAPVEDRGPTMTLQVIAFGVTDDMWPRSLLSRNLHDQSASVFTVVCQGP